MKTLIVHPKDTTTNFLKPIYTPIKDKTVITGGVTKTELKELIVEHYRIIMLGHGSPLGLLSVGQFPIAGEYIINESMVPLLKEKEDNLYIWCNADRFVDKYRLNGLYTGMFISEFIEAIDFGFWNVDWSVIQESNERFSNIVGRYIDEPIEVLFDHLIVDYGSLAQTNPIARFNIERLYYNAVKSFVEVDDVKEIY